MSLIWFAGENPGGLLGAVLDDDRRPRDITGMTVKFRAEHEAGTVVTLDGTVADGPAGVTAVELTSAVTALEGRWRGQWWATNGTTLTYATTPVRWVVRPPVKASSL